MPSFRTALLALGAFALATGCAAKRKITYDLDPVAPRATPAAPSLDVGSFSDARAENPSNGPLFTLKHSDVLAGRAVCLNAEANYEAGTVARQVSDAVRAHLAHRRSFDTVSLDGTGAAYRLDGKIKSLYGVQDQSTSAKVGSAFGLIGAIATAGVKTKGVVRVELADLALSRADGTVVKRLPDVVETYEGELPADAYCWTIFHTVNERLRVAVERLADEVELAVGATPRPPPAPAAAAPEEAPSTTW